MPTDHRGNPVDGPSGNCVNCGAAGSRPVGKGHRLCEDCHYDYRTFMPYMHGGVRPFWEDDATVDE